MTLTFISSTFFSHTLIILCTPPLTCSVYFTSTLVKLRSAHHVARGLVRRCAGKVVLKVNMLAQLKQAQSLQVITSFKSFIANVANFEPQQLATGAQPRGVVQMS